MITPKKPIKMKPCRAAMLAKQKAEIKQAKSLDKDTLLAYANQMLKEQRAVKCQDHYTHGIEVGMERIIRLIERTKCS